jgi:Tol biopolymer transport system component
MKRMFSIAEGLLGLLVLVGLAVVLAMTLDQLREGAQPGFQTFQSPIETPTLPPYPLPETPTVVPMPVPPCLFAGQPVPAEPAPPLEAYRFSEPRVVLTHPSAIGIAGWLPDGQRLLITRLTPDQSGEYIETFNVKTGELQRYGEWQGFSIVSNPKPVWLASAQAVAFVDVSHNKQNVLLISRGEGLPLEEVVTGLATPYLAVSSDGRRVVFFTAQDRPEAFDVAQAQRQTFPFTLPLTPWQELSALGQQFGPELYRAAWHPNGDQIAFYNDTGFYLADLPSGQICELDLGFEKSEARYGKRWAFDVQWSPNGRYLAMLTTVGDSPVGFSDLTILDTLTGKLRSMHPERYIEPGRYYVTDLSWAPNSHDMAILVTVKVDEMGASFDELYLTDITSGEFRPLVSSWDFGGPWGGSLSWSYDGLKLAALCPRPSQTTPPVAENRLCIIPIDRGDVKEGQP